MPAPDLAIAALVLAAGGGSRLGGGKLLLPWRGKPIIAHTLAAIFETAELCSVTVALGHDAPAVRRVVEVAARDAAAPSPRVVENPHWRDGMGGSLRAGLEAILAAPDGAATAAVLVALGDQPLAAAATYSALCRAHAAAARRDPAHPATAPVYDGRRGNPVILSRALFPEILALRGDAGARHILAALGGRVLLVPVEDSGVVRDVDTPEEYEGLGKQE